MLSLFVIIALEPVAGISLNYDENTYDRQSLCYQGILRFEIWLREIFSNSTCLPLKENKNKNAAVQVAVVFRTCEQVDSRKVFWNRSFRPLK